MRKNIYFCFYLTFLILLLLSLVFARPNPVPNDERDPDQDLEHYEKDHEKLTPPSRSSHRRQRRPGPEDPEDEDVIKELEYAFGGIPRRNRDIYYVRPNIFQDIIDSVRFRDGEDDN